MCTMCTLYVHTLSFDAGINFVTTFGFFDCIHKKNFAVRCTCTHISNLKGYRNQKHFIDVYKVFYSV